MLDEVPYINIIFAQESSPSVEQKGDRCLSLSQAGPAHIEAFLAVLKAVTKEETVQYVLASLVQLLQGNRYLQRPTTELLDVFHYNYNLQRTLSEPGFFTCKVTSTWPLSLSPTRCS